MTFVIDASITMAWYFEDESTREADELLERVSDTGAVVPAHWRLEVANAFQMAIRRQRIDALYRDDSLAELALMPIAVDDDTNNYAWSTTMRLAERFSLTLYDAAYLELARRRSLGLATWIAICVTRRRYSRSRCWARAEGETTGDPSHRALPVGVVAAAGIC